MKEQLLRELDMYQEIAVAKGSEYDTLNQRMDKCQDNIEKLSDDIQRLQGINKVLYCAIHFTTTIKRTVALRLKT